MNKTPNQTIRFTRHELFPVFCVAAFYVGIVYLVGSAVLQQFPNSADEFAYLYQAHTIASGDAVNNAHLQQEALSPFFIHTHHDNVFSIFPPGWATVLSFGVLINATGLINPMLAGLSIIVLFTISRYFLTLKWSWAVLGIWMLSPMVVLNSASLFSHPLCSVLIMTVIWFLLRFHNQPIWMNTLLTGFITALAFSTRELTSLAMLCIPMIYILIQTPQKTRFCTGLLVGALPIALLYGWYCSQITGTWFYPPRYLLQDEYLGFGMRENRLFDYTEQLYFGPAEAWNNSSRNLLLLLQYTTLSFPFWLVLGVYNIWKHAWMRVFSLSCVLLIGVYALYPSDGGNQYGARFYYEMLPFMAIAVVWNLNQFEIVPTVIKRIHVSVLIGVGLVILALQYYPLRTIHDQIYQRRELFRLVEHREIENAIVFVASPSGDMTQGDLIRNLPDYQNAPVIYAWHLGERNQELMSAFPNRSYYQFIRDEQTGLAALIPIGL